MVKFAEMDDEVTLFAQLEDTGGPVVLINKFNVDPGEADQLIQAWAADAAVMQRMPGYISTQLHRGIGGSCVFLNYAVWESTRHFKQAFNNPDFQSQLAHYPSSAVASPHLFRKVAVQGICVD
jgi:heme-degrading monooxygenase HmoA